MTLIRNEITGGYSAVDPKKERHEPSLTEKILKKLITPKPAETEFFVGPRPDSNNAVLEAIIERQQIVKEAQRLNSRVTVENLQKFVDAIFNDGASLATIEKYATMDPSPHLVEEVQHLFDAAGVLGIPTIEDIEAIAAVARAILNHVMTHRGGKHEFEVTLQPKTPFQAWRVKEMVNDHLLHEEPILVEPGGFDSSRQVKEFYANFNVADLVLWNHDIWKAAIRGCENFKGTPLTADIIDCAMPMFWQFDLPFLGPKSLDLESRSGKKYECVGFVILPTLEDYVHITFSAGDGIDFIPSKNDPDRGFVTVDTSKPEVRKAIAEARKEVLNDKEHMKFSRRGINIAIVYLPINGDLSPEVRFVKPLYEDDKIYDSLTSVIAAGLKFLSLKYVAQDTVEVARKELKKDRTLFKQVRHGKVQVPPIKIINLRRAEVRTKKEVAEDNKTHRVYSCHFMVDPHWRKQWIPSKKRHEPRRILTYVKGDLSKPFKPPREKIYKAMR